MHLTHSVEERNSVLTSRIVFVGVQLSPTSDLMSSAVVTAHFTDGTTGEIPGQRKEGEGVGLDIL